MRALEHRWDVVPVVLQDPLWERSFPAVDGFVLDVADVDGRVARGAPHPRRDRGRATRAHETRWAELLESFERASLEPVVVESSDEGGLLRAFLRWVGAPPGGSRRVVRRAALAGALAALALATAACPSERRRRRDRAACEATLTPSPVLFGQSVTAELDLLVNTKKADPGSVQTRAPLFYRTYWSPRPCARTSATATSFASATPTASPATRSTVRPARSASVGSCSSRR